VVAVLLNKNVSGYNYYVYAQPYVNKIEKI